MEKARRKLSFKVISILVWQAFMAPLLLLAQNPSRITVIDDAVRVRVAQTTHPLIASASDLGRADPNLRMDRMLLVLGPSAEKQPELRTFLDSLQDKNSTNFHHWLTPEQFGERFGPSQADVAKIAAWLQARGFDGVKIARGRGHIEFSGSAQLVERAFQTQMHSFQMGTKSYLANATDISLPRAIAGMVRGVNLHNFSFSKPALTQHFVVHRDLAAGRWVTQDPATGFLTGNFMSPADFARIYNLEPVYQGGITGKGQTIAVVARSSIELSDVESFRRAAGLPFNDPNLVVNGSQMEQAFDFSSDEIEASLDAEWAGAVAPDATVDVVISRSTATTDGVVLSSAYIVDNNLADIMSVSFEACEQHLGTLNSFFRDLWQQAAAQGISVFVATGDQGAAGCAPNAPSPFPAQGGLAVNGLASTPFNTAVGGTQFQDNASASFFWNPLNDAGLLSVKGYIPEAVWNESFAGIGFFSFAAGGGGVSTIYPKPVWQSTSIPGVPSDNARDLPDVSLTAAVHDAYLFCVSVFAPCPLTISGDQVMLQNAGAIGGTSASSPSFAGIMALLNQKHGGRQGLANYGLYRLAAQENFAGCNSSSRTDPNIPAPSQCVFNDITAGNNSVPGQSGYSAAFGYDPAAGLGSINGANLLDAWNALSFQTSQTTLAATSATSVQHGTPVSFSITVAPGSGTVTPTGEVGLIALNAGADAGVGSGTLVNGAFSGSVNALPGGQYNVIAHYAGDGTFAASDSNPVAVNINSEPSSISITGFDQNGVPQPSPLSFGYGDPFTVGLNVTSGSGAGHPAGTVTVFDNGVPAGTVRVNSEGFTKILNCALDFTFCLPFGQHTITASYSGDASFAPSQSQPFVYNIVKGAPIGSLLFEGNDLMRIVKLAFFQSSLQIPPTGTFTLLDTFNGQTTQLTPPVQLSGPEQILGQFTLPPGTHHIAGKYSGDNNYLPVDFPQLTLTQPLFPGLPTQVTITPLSSSPVVGQPITLKVTVTSSQSNAAPAGFADWFVSDMFLTLNSSHLSNGTATLQTILPATGPIAVEYDGDSTFAPSVSAPLLLNIVRATPAVTVKASPKTVLAGDQATVTVTVTPPAGAASPDLFVQFFDNGQPFGNSQFLPSVRVIPGTSTASIPANLSLGTHVFTAAYLGDNNFNPVPASSSVSATVNVVSSLPAPVVSPDFGAVAVGSESPIQSVALTFTASGVVNAIKTVTQGGRSAEFLWVSPGSCLSGTAFTAGQTCSVDVVFAPGLAGMRSGAVVLTGAGDNILAASYIFGVGDGPQIAFDFGSQVVSFDLQSGTHIAATSGNLYFALNGSAQVIKLPNACQGACQTVVASASNGLASADGVAVDGAGNLYVSDPVGNQVVKVPPGCVTSSCTTVVASNASGGIHGPRGLAVDAAGDLFIVDQDNNRVVEVPAGCATSACQIAMGSGLGLVLAVAVDLAGNVYISDTNNNRVVKLPPGCAGGTCQTTAVSGLSQPKGLAVDAAGNLYIVDNSGVLEVSALNGNQRLLVTAAQLQSSGTPSDMALDQAGNLYIAGPALSSLWKLDRAEAPVLPFGQVALNSTSLTENVVIENIGTRPLSLNGISANFNTALDSSATTCIAGGALAPGGSCVVGVEFAPLMAGGVSGKVAISDNAQNIDLSTQSIVVFGIGVPSVLPDFTMAGSLPSLTLRTGQSGAVNITITPSGGLNAPISFSCSPSGLVQCSFNPPSVTPSGAPVSTMLTVTASGTTAVLRAPRTFRPAPLAFGSGVLGIAVGLVVIAAGRKQGRKKPAGILLCCILVALVVAGLTGCGGGSSPGGGGGGNPQTVTLTVSASAQGGASHTLSLTVTVVP